MKFETLYSNCYGRGSVRRLFDVTMRDAPSHIWKLFCIYRTVKFLTYADVIEDSKQRMQTTSLVTIHCGKTMRYDVSPDDKKMAVHLRGLHVQALDSATRPRCG